MATAMGAAALLLSMRTTLGEQLGVALDDRQHAPQVVGQVCGEVLCGLTPPGTGVG
jgi:hypothetical protein